ncbi:hypothetical protein [Streptomyces sp. NPDC059928]|uniref:hypothetical protein n=1 Tax=unclassified Streptomyces TaxID=2593676 RepID=UPI0036677C1E
MYAIQPPSPYVPPEPIRGEEGCGPCAVIIAQLRRARQDRNPSQEVDARVRLRRHVREEHGREMPDLPEG